MTKSKQKNEFRLDLNKKHYGKNKKPHPAYISAESGEFYKANTITHSKYTKYGEPTKHIKENANKNSKEKGCRISPPFWQHKSKFRSKPMTNYKFSFLTRLKIKFYNHSQERKHKK